MKSKGRPVGHHGSWFAEYQGQRLPCVHAKWQKRGRYHDPHATLGNAKFRSLFSAICSLRRVIVTADRELKDGQFRRTGYVAVREVISAELDGKGLRLRLGVETARFV